MVLLRCPPEQLQQQGQEVLSKFSDLVVKCLIKLTKALQSTLDVRPVDVVRWPHLRLSLSWHQSVVNSWHFCSIFLSACLSFSCTDRYHSIFGSASCC